MAHKSVPGHKLLGNITHRGPLVHRGFKEYIPWNKKKKKRRIASEQIHRSQEAAAVRD